MKKMSPSMYWGMTRKKVIRQTNDSQARLQALKANIQKGSSHR